MSAQAQPKQDIWHEKEGKVVPMMRLEFVRDSKDAKLMMISDEESPWDDKVVPYDELTEPVRDKLASLAVMPPEGGTEPIHGVGLRISEYVFWVELEPGEYGT